jgi:hypothetical protein
MKTSLLKKYGLQKWFDNTFDVAEKRILISAYPDFTDDEAVFNSSYAASFLANSLMWYNKKDNAVICMKVISKILELLNDTADISAYELHFIYLPMIQTLYKNRDFENAFDLAIDICNRQIKIAPVVAKEILSSPFNSIPILPEHIGFKQLAIIEKKNKNWLRVIELCKIAKSQGWDGNWDKRIDEARKNLK